MIIMLSVTFVLFIIQIIYHLYIYNIPSTNKRKITDETLLPPLSVIIVAKDSVSQLSSNIIPVLEQDYPNFEVIVVYEQEEKMFGENLTLLQEKYKNLYHTFIPKTARYISHKKLGITIGIKASRNDVLVYTEPNAYPSSNQWLRRMASNFTSGTDIVIGYSNYERKNTWLNKKIVFDRLLMYMRTMGFAIRRHPYTASGYNLAYRKSLFYDNNGFNKHLNLQRGEDDLFINEYANKKNTKVETSRGSVIRINEPFHKYEWSEEKLSSIITEKYYKGFAKYMAGFETTSRLMFIIAVWTTAILATLSSEWTYLAIDILLLVTKLSIQLYVFNNTCKNFNERRYYFLLPIFNIVNPLSNLSLHIKELLANKKDFLRK